VYNEYQKVHNIVFTDAAGKLTFINPSNDSVFVAINEMDYKLHKSEVFCLPENAGYAIGDIIL
jgi:hypothetical protein